MTADWNEIIAGKSAWLRQLVRRHLRRPEEVEDVVQEVLAAAVAQPPGTASGVRCQEIDRWLRGLALNKVRMHCRSEGRRRQRENSIRPDAGDTGESPLGRLLQAERRGQLRRAIGMLSPDDARVLDWKYVHGWDYNRIAAELGVSRDAVANRLRAARDRLREAVRRLLPEE